MRRRKEWHSQCKGGASRVNMNAKVVQAKVVQRWKANKGVQWLRSLS